MDGRIGGSARCTDRYGTLQSTCMGLRLPMTNFHPNAGMWFPQNLGPSAAGRASPSPHSTHFSINAEWITGLPCRVRSRVGPAVRVSAPTCRGDAFRWPQRFARWRSGSPHSGRPRYMVRAWIVAGAARSAVLRPDCDGTATSCKNSRMSRASNLKICRGPATG